MNKVILESDLNDKKIKYFIKRISNNKSDFEIPKSLMKDISLIQNRGDQQIIYYVLYKIITENKLHVNISPKPNKGLLFTDYDNKPNTLEIFHCHLNNNKVLIWYVSKDSNNNLNLEIEYIDHPDDDYKSVLKNIYKNTDGYNTIINQYFKNYISKTYLKDSFIQKWFNFTHK
jgi:hypothetical protein